MRRKRCSNALTPKHLLALRHRWTRTTIRLRKWDREHSTKMRQAGQEINSESGIAVRNGDEISKVCKFALRHVVRQLRG
jgi:hypothetical protein